MNFTTLKHGFWAFGALLLACNKPAPATTSTPAASTPAGTTTTAKENLLWIPVGDAKTLQTAKDLLGSGTDLAKASDKTKFTKPAADPTQTTLTNEYELTVDVDDIKPNATSTESKFLGIRLKVQNGVSYTVLRSFLSGDTKETSSDANVKDSISFDVVTETEASTDAKSWKTELEKHLNPNPEFVTYDAAKPKHTLVLFNGAGKSTADAEAQKRWFQNGGKATLLLVVQKGTESQVIRLVLNFVAATAATTPPSSVKK